MPPLALALPCPALLVLVLAAEQLLPALVLALPWPLAEVPALVLCLALPCPLPQVPRLAPEVPEVPQVPPLPPLVPEMPPCCWPLVMAAGQTPTRLGCPKRGLALALPLAVSLAAVPLALPLGLSLAGTMAQAIELTQLTLQTLGRVRPGTLGLSRNC